MYLSGCEKNKYANKRGNAKKTAVMGIKDMAAGTIGATPVPETTAPALNTSSNLILSRVSRCIQPRIYVL